MGMGYIKEACEHADTPPPCIFLVCHVKLYLDSITVVVTQLNDTILVTKHCCDLYFQALCPAETQVFHTKRRELSVFDTLAIF